VPKITVNSCQQAIKLKIQVPGDKSISHRSVMLASLAEGSSEISGFLNGEDCLCTQKAFTAMGVEVENISETALKIHGKKMADLKKPTQDLYLGNSGTAMRLLTGLYTNLAFDTKLTGDESLSSRPMDRVILPLAEMGAKISSEAGYKAPLTIHSGSKLHGITYHSPVASAQVKSCIMLATLRADSGSTIIEPERSRDHTERMLAFLGAHVEVDGLKVHIDPLERPLSAAKIEVPADISSAAFWLVAGAIVPGSEIELPCVGINPTRMGVIEALEMMQVKLQIQNKRLAASEPRATLVIKHADLKACEIAGALIPRLIDEIPILAILAAQAEGTTIIKDAEELKVKESNRITSTINMLRALGVEVEETSDGMIIQGQAGSPFGDANKKGEKIIIDSKGDHRIAMSSAIAALHAHQPVEILQSEFINTSFPNFFDILTELKVLDS
jgi:3-phosphoshikimate 1-carboxyvinyltransferase